MATEIDTNAVEATARELLEQRVQAVRELAKARQRTIDLREQLAEVERADSTAYQAARRAGWGADELRRVGLGEPRKRGPGRPRGARTKSAQSRPAKPDSEGTPEPETQRGSEAA